MCDILCVSLEEEDSFVAFEKLWGMSINKARVKKKWDGVKLQLVGKLAFFAVRNLITNVIQSRRTWH